MRDSHSHISDGVEKSVLYAAVYSQTVFYICEVSLRIFVKYSFHICGISVTQILTHVYFFSYHKQLAERVYLIVEIPLGDELLPIKGGKLELSQSLGFKHERCVTRESVAVVSVFKRERGHLGVPYFRYAPAVG